MSAYDFTFQKLEGGELPLSAYRGKALLVVNTASYCGFTPQYEGLEALYRKYRDKGLVVLGVPSNDFGAQEPGNATEIAHFCDTKFHIDFPMSQRENVTGPDTHPLYRWIVEQKGATAAPKWNFHKYLIGKDGEVAGVFPSSTRPDSKELIDAIETALA